MTGNIGGLSVRQVAHMCRYALPVLDWCWGFGCCGIDMGEPRRQCSSRFRRLADGRVRSAK